MTAPTDPVTPHKIGATIRVTHEELADDINVGNWFHTALRAAEAERRRRATMTPTQLAAYDAANIAKAEAAQPPPPRPECPDPACTGGWLGEDPSTGTPIPCRHCRPHLKPLEAS